MIESSDTSSDNRDLTSTTSNAATTSPLGVPREHTGSDKVAPDKQSGPTATDAAPATSSRAAAPGFTGSSSSGGHHAAERAPVRTVGKRHVILFLASNPSETDRLALDREARAIHLELKRSGFRDRFDFQTRWAAKPLDLLSEVRELKPTVVHFSGHGALMPAVTGAMYGRDVMVESMSGTDTHGLVFHGPAGRPQVVSSEAIAQTLDAAGPSVRLVVLNACFTESMAEALLGHVDCVVGMSSSIHDAAARAFAVGFYGGLGEHESIAVAFRQGRAAVRLDGLQDVELPQLKVRDGFDPAELVLAAISPARRRELPCPYPGMRPYDADDAGNFHGRDGEIAELIGRLRAGEREVFGKVSR